MVSHHPVGRVPRTVVRTGASGQVGLSVLRALAAAGHHVVALTHRPHVSDAARTVPADISVPSLGLPPQLFGELSRQADAVVHCAAATDFRPDTSRTWSVNVRGTEHGALLDLGPHLLDLLDAAVGPVTAIRATGDPRRWVELTWEHENGAVSQASLSGSVAVPRALTRVELFGVSEPLVYDTAGLNHEECWPVLRHDFAMAVRSRTPTPLDAGRGLYLQGRLDGVVYG
ncbi:SDR family oxidoreductase [Streptomyces sp. AD681]|uniref:SDR family oxidoreductase n=1 Tax=Streptomyces sp. AD681 TaxID=3019069 RepID=UPI003FA6B69F